MITEEKIERIVRQTIKEGLSTMVPGERRNSSHWDDGAYTYQPLEGNPESAERVRRMRKELPGWSKTPGAAPDAFYSTKHGESTSAKMDREDGGLEYTPHENAGELSWCTRFVDTLRNIAGGKECMFSDGKSMTKYDLDRLVNQLKTKEGAAEFIKYLFTNGFKATKFKAHSKKSNNRYKY